MPSDGTHVCKRFHTKNAVIQDSKEQKFYPIACEVTAIALAELLNKLNERAN
jgi:hypothetical protein